MTWENIFFENRPYKKIKNEDFCIFFTLSESIFIPLENLFELFKRFSLSNILSFSFSASLYSKRTFFDSESELSKKK